MPALVFEVSVMIKYEYLLVSASQIVADKTILIVNYLYFIVLINSQRT